MSESKAQSVDLEHLQRDMAALRNDVALLLGHLKTGATNGVEAAVNQIDDGAQLLYRTATAEGERAVRAIGRQIEQQPVVALLIVLGIGYIGGRLLSR